MNNTEFLNEFNLLYNNAMSNQAPPLNEYEISLFLTEGQEVVVKEYYSGKNAFRDSFERSEEVTRSLSSLVRTEVLTEEYNPEYISDIVETIGSSSYLYKIPQDVWYIVKESVKFTEDAMCGYGSYADVIPTTHDKVGRIMENPFRGMSNRRVLRLSLGNNINELLSKYPVHSYLIRYLVQPSPIVLVNLDSLGCSVDGVSEETECKLHPLIHRVILERAVRIASEAYKFQKQ